MSIRTEIRETERYVKAMTSDPKEQIAIISKAQELTAGIEKREHYLSVMAIVKSRIIRGM